MVAGLAGAWRVARCPGERVLGSLIPYVVLSRIARYPAAVIDATAESLPLDLALAFRRHRDSG